jgi:hypothetical protein
MLALRDRPLPELESSNNLPLRSFVDQERHRISRKGSHGSARPVQHEMGHSRTKATPQGGGLQLTENTTIGARGTPKVAEAAAPRSFSRRLSRDYSRASLGSMVQKRGSAMPGEGMALAGPIQSKGAAVGGTTLRRVGSATLQGRVGIPDGRRRPPTAIGGARRTDRLLTSPRSESGQNCSLSAKL